MELWKMANLELPATGITLQSPAPQIAPDANAVAAVFCGHADILD